MFELDAFHLARLQFAFTVSFHIIFPALTIGLASYLVVLEGMWLKTKNDVWRSLYHFWLKIFAVNFGMGVVSGIVMSYQFGTNWSGYADFTGKAAADRNLPIDELEPRQFSFNGPWGACPECSGIGTRMEVDPELVVPDDEKSLDEGAIAPWSNAPASLLMRWMK